MNLEEIEIQLHRGKQIEEVMKDISWHEFEHTIGKILERHEFEVKRNFRFKTTKRYEIDILATKKNVVLAIDCKKWCRGRYKSSALKKAIKKQKERVRELKKMRLGVFYRVYPLMVTLWEEDLILFDDVFVVPVWKLNNFILNFEGYSELQNTFLD